MAKKLTKVQKEKIKTSIENLAYSLKRNTDIIINEQTNDDIKFLLSDSWMKQTVFVSNVLISLYIAFYENCLMVNLLNL